ncbi:hypothetical protein O181_100005 [Austropuccinia psidii MF-1]|uniref:Uncharacterized protein n=1 Tax=Austropuccinia psidii MF-1 TaxID=1389203 RepID=A0A9Q3JEQ7_9BASI|nr:hypothetical protein [Austropuccinia psidii MF-1]
MSGGMPPYMTPGCLLFLTHTCLHFSRIPTLHTQILTPVQDPNFVQANPYACTGSQQFKPLLPPGKAPKDSKNSLRQYRLLMLHTQIFTLLQVPNNSNNSLCRFRLSMRHR